jgi:hypothetical protein
MKYLVAIVLLFATPAFAQHHPGVTIGPGIHIGPGGGYPGGYPQGGWPDHRDRWAGGRFIGFGRHFWNGVWWDYGVGDCWALGPDGRWWWICD